MTDWYEILILLLLVVSVLVNVALVSYIRQNIIKVFVISEESAEIFTMIDSFREHLKSVYELPTFYGDDTLSGLLDHTNAVAQYLMRFENVFSFTQPDLLEQLEQASIELRQQNEETEAKEEE